MLTLTKSKSGDMEIAPQSAVAKLLQHYGANSPKEMIGKEVVVHPDENNFLVIAACDLEEDTDTADDLFTVEKD